jgi:hypothetical protein
MAEPGYSRQLETYAESRSTRAVAESLKSQLLKEEQLSANFLNS